MGFDVAMADVLVVHIGQPTNHLETVQLQGKDNQEVREQATTGGWGGGGTG